LKTSKIQGDARRAAELWPHQGDANVAPFSHREGAGDDATGSRIVSALRCRREGARDARPRRLLTGFQLITLCALQNKAFFRPARLK